MVAAETPSAPCPAPGRRRALLHSGRIEPPPLDPKPKQTGLEPVSRRTAARRDSGGGYPIRVRERSRLPTRSALDPKRVVANLGRRIALWPAVAVLSVAANQRRAVVVAGRDDVIELVVRTLGDVGLER